MPQTFDDKFMVDPRQGFLMIFFGRPEIDAINLESLARHVGNRGRIEYGRSSDGYHLTSLIDDNTYKTVLMVGRHDDGYVMIRSDLRPAQLSCALKNVPEQDRAIIRAALKGHLPAYTPMLEAWVQNANNMPYELARDLVRTLPSLTDTKPAAFTPRQAFNIMQSEYGVSHIRADRPVLASTGAGPCVILAVYNPKNRTGMLTHLDDATERDTISEAVFDLRKDANDPLIAHMTGGWDSTYWMVADMAMRLQELPNVTLKGWSESERLSSMALDMRTGDICVQFNESQIDPGPYVQKRQERIAAAIGGWRDPRPYLIYHHKHGGYGTIRL